MLIQLHVGGERFLYDVESLSDLQKRTMVHLGNLLDTSGGTKRLSITYDVPVVGGARDETVSVNTDADFKMSLEVWDTVIRPRQLKRQEALLPTYFASLVEGSSSDGGTSATLPHQQALPEAVPTASQALEDTTVSCGGRKRAPPPTSTNVSSPPLKHQPSTDNITTPVGAGNTAASKKATAPIDTDWYHSHDVASRLLASFNPSAPEEPATIRVTLRGGQASTRIRFDPFNRPDITDLKQRIASEMLRRMPKEEQDRINATVASGEATFLLYACTPSVPVDVDMEDNADVAFVCDEIKKFDNDFSVQLICEWVGSEEPLPAISEDVRFVQTDLVDVILPPRCALAVNLAHTPKREHHEPRGIQLDE